MGLCLGKSEMTKTSDLSAFARLVIALEPWLDDVVIVGGWAHRLYRLHPSAQHLDYAPIMTLDTDLAVPAVLPAKEQDIRERLLQNGFTEEFLGDDNPPATHYRLGKEPTGFYAEFLTPLVGEEYDRKNRRKATAQISGITSQRMRYIDLLLKHPWSVKLDLDGFAGRVQLASPASFLVQKILIHEKRKVADRAKDILYMHDTIEVFGGSLRELHDEWTKKIAPQLHPRQRAKVLNASHLLFGASTDDVRRAVLIAADRALSVEALTEACRYGFDQVFR